MRQGRKNIAGWWMVGEKCYYFKSIFEMRWAAILEICKRHDEIAQVILNHSVADWIYEPRRFQFFGDDLPKKLKGKSLGVRVYTPDFRVVINGQRHIWHEAKGYMGGPDTTKLRCFHTYFPDEPLMVIVDGLPKGKTAKSRTALRRYDFLKPCGYTVLDAHAIIRDLSGWTNRITLKTKR